MERADYTVDFARITPAEADDYLADLRGRDRENRRRIQAWFDHCARIRADPSSMITAAERHSHR
jgi:hypothetical protein